MVMDLGQLIGDSLQVRQTYPKGVKSALQVYRETRQRDDERRAARAKRKYKPKEYFVFDLEKPLLAQIENAINGVTRVDYIEYVQYLKDIGLKSLVKELIKADYGGNLTQVQANFSNYLYLLIADSHVLGHYIDEAGSHCAAGERERLIDRRIKHLVDLWNKLEERAISLSNAEYCNLPSTPATQLIHNTLTAGLDVEDLPQRKREYTHNYQYAFSTHKSKGKQSITIRETTSNSVTTITIGDIGILVGNNKSLRQFFTYILIGVYQQSYSMGQMRRNYVEFTLEDLVHNNMYKSIESARLGFNNNWKALKTISIGESSIKISKKKQIISDDEDVLFISKRLKNNVCKIYINPNINWDILTHFFALIPAYSVSLSNRASILILHIFTTLRKNTDKIKKNGYYDFSCKSLQSVLWLPSAEGCANPGRDIRKPIEDSIAEIEGKQAELLNSGDIRLELMNDTSRSIKAFLSNAFLRVYVSGTLYELLAGIAASESLKVAQPKKVAARKENG